MKSLVLYHASCADGFTAAWCAWQTFGDSGADYRAVQYDRGLPDFTDKEGNAVEYENVYVLDFSFDAAELRELADRVPGKVILLDHHKTAVEKLRPLMDEPDPRIVLVFNMEKSGAMLAWEHFVGATDERLVPPVLVQYVQDRDLWIHEMPHCHEIRAYAETVPFKFDDWDELASELEADAKFENGEWVFPGAEAVAERGTQMMRYRNVLVDRRARKPGFINLCGHILPCVNDTNFGSEVGNKLSQEYPAAVIFFVTNWGKVVYSLRSAKENPNHLDVSEIAKKFEGGGHKHAAGFRSNALPMFVEACGHDTTNDDGSCSHCGVLNVSVDEVDDA
jgi:oligoribonuclease NrnB/cAMP/cGMP phosphodiesterase (DHH superfamily)